MSIVVQTQHMENYGSEENVNHWKFKWGSAYMVEGTDQRPANAVALVTHYIAKFNRNANYAMEFVTDWYAVQEGDDDHARLSSEEYYNYNALTNTPTVLQYERDIIPTNSPTIGQVVNLPDEQEECGCSSCACPTADLCESEA